MHSLLMQFSKIGLAGPLLLACAINCSAVTFNYSTNCAVPTTIGPLTITNVDSSGGSVNLTPGVPSTASILTVGANFTQNSSNLTSGTFNATLACTLTFGGISVNYSQPLSLTILPSGSTCVVPGGGAGGCLVWLPVSVTVNLGAAGTVAVSAPGRGVLGYVASSLPGNIVLFPGAAIDTATLTSAPPPGIPLPPSLTLALTGLAAAGLYHLARRRLAGQN